MHNRRALIVGLAGIARLFTAAFDNLIDKRRMRLPGEFDSRAERRRERQQARRVFYFKRGRSNARMSGKGPRECARRVGGQAWANFKAADRARRGLV